MKALKILMMFITAIWGFLLGISIPITMLANVDGITNEVPAYIAVIWLITSIIGFIVPCFLVKFKIYKTAAALSLVGAAFILYINNALNGSENGLEWFCMPLLIETLIIVIITVSTHKTEVRRRHNAPLKAKSMIIKNENPKENQNNKKIQTDSNKKSRKKRKK